MNKKHLWGMLFVGLIFVITVIGYFYTPYDHSKTQVLVRLQPPSRVHFFGTDHFGRDIFSRALVGAQVSLVLGFLSVSAGSLVGVLFGLWSGFKGGLWDTSLTNFNAGLQALPTILLALLFATIWNSGTMVIFWSVALGNIPVFFRLTRTQVLKIKVQPYLEAAQASGATEGQIIFRHIVPNLQTALLVQFSLSLAGAILVEASLSYLGVGIQPPTPSWGRMLKDAQSFASIAPWGVLFPGFLVALTVIGFNLLGESEIFRRYR